MKIIIPMLFMVLLLNIAYADEESDAGAIGPENRVLYAFDRVGDNIASFLSRIGGEDSHANTVRRIVAERRAEHLRLLRLKNDGEITQEEYVKSVSTLSKSLKSNEDKLLRSEKKLAEKERVNKIYKS